MDRVGHNLWCWGSDLLGWESEEILYPFSYLNAHKVYWHTFAILTFLNYQSLSFL